MIYLLGVVAAVLLGAGVVLQQSAGPLHASLPAITAGEPLAGITLGIVVYGDHLPTSPEVVAMQVAGLMALLAGVILVARGPAVASVRARARGKPAHGPPGHAEP